MKTYHSSLRFVILPLLVLKLLAVSSLAQSENPVQGSNTTVVPGPVDNTTRGEIVPLFWRALIEESIINVPLVSIEHFGVQTYVVHGVARVRELTITTKSQSMIRIYHMTPLKSVAEGTIEGLEKIIENVSGEELHVPVKVFPSTTHAQMVEYRTSELSHIDKLYEHLETAMKDYHARVLVPGQREETVRQVKVGGK